MAEPRTRVKHINPDERATVPLRLIGQLIRKTTPPVAEDTAVHRAFTCLAVARWFPIHVQLLFRLPRHLPHRQILHADELVIFDQLVRHLVLESSHGSGVASRKP